MRPGSQGLCGEVIRNHWNSCADIVVPVETLISLIHVEFEVLGADHIDVTTLLASETTEERTALGTVTLALLRSAAFAPSSRLAIPRKNGRMLMVLSASSVSEVICAVPFASTQNFCAEVARGSHSRQKSPTAQQLAS